MVDEIEKKNAMRHELCTNSSWDVPLVLYEYKDYVCFTESKALAIPERKQANAMDIKS